MKLTFFINLNVPISLTISINSVSTGLEFSFMNTRQNATCYPKFAEVESGGNCLSKFRCSSENAQ